MRKLNLSLALMLSIFLLLGASLAAFADQSARGVINDSAITAAVKNRLATDVRLGTLTGVEVNTTKGVVSLSGKAHTAQEKEYIGQVVSGVDGVGKVKNNLQVVPD